MDQSGSDAAAWGRAQHRQDGARLQAAPAPAPTQGEWRLSSSLDLAPRTSVCTPCASDVPRVTAPVPEPRVSTPEGRSPRGPFKRPPGGVGGPWLLRGTLPGRASSWSCPAAYRRGVRCACPRGLVFVSLVRGHLSAGPQVAVQGAVLWLSRYCAQGTEQAQPPRPSRLLVFS